jgi:hypothetical protein
VEKRAALSGNDMRPLRNRTFIVENQQRSDDTLDPCFGGLNRHRAALRLLVDLDGAEDLLKAT